MTDDDRPQPGGVPLSRPYYQVPVGEAIRRFWRKYATFTGRASRSEFWWWWLTWFAAALVLQFGGDVLSGHANDLGESQVGTSLFVVWVLATVVGMFALGARRLHDANLTGWLQVIVVIPILGWVAVLVIACLPPNPSGSRYDGRNVLRSSGPRGQD